MILSDDLAKCAQAGYEARRAIEITLPPWVSCPVAVRQIHLSNARRALEPGPEWTMSDYAIDNFFTAVVRATANALTAIAVEKLEPARDSA